MRCGVLVNDLVKDVFKDLAAPGGVGKDFEDLRQKGHR